MACIHVLADMLALANSSQKNNNKHRKVKTFKQHYLLDTQVNSWQANTSLVKVNVRDGEQNAT